MVFKNFRRQNLAVPRTFNGSGIKAAVLGTITTPLKENRYTCFHKASDGGGRRRDR